MHSGGGQRYGRLVAALLLASLAIDLVRVWHITSHHDLDVFLLAAQRIVYGEDIYADTSTFRAEIESGHFSLRDDSVVWPYAYAPTIALVFAPFQALPKPLIHAAWWGLNVAAWLWGSWLCVRIAGGPSAWQVAIVALALYRFQPAVAALRLGQIELLQYLLIVLALWALQRNREALGGILIGVTTALKFFPGALVALFLWRRRWHAAFWAIGSAGVLILGAYAIVGWDALSTYLDYADMYGIGGAFAAFPLNQSLNGFFSRNLVANAFSATLKGWHRPALARALVWGSSLLLITVSARLTWHPQRWPIYPTPHDRERFAFEYALGVTTLLIVSPHSQTYALVWLLIPLILLASWLLSPMNIERSGPMWPGLVIAYLAVGRDYVLFRPGLTRIVQAHYLIGMLLLWGLLALVLWRSHRPAALVGHKGG